MAARKYIVIYGCGEKPKEVSWEDLNKNKRKKYDVPEGSFLGAAGKCSGKRILRAYTYDDTVFNILRTIIWNIFVTMTATVGAIMIVQMIIRLIRSVLSISLSTPVALVLAVFILIFILAILRDRKLYGKFKRFFGDAKPVLEKIQKNEIGRKAVDFIGDCLLNTSSENKDQPSENKNDSSSESP